MKFYLYFFKNFMFKTLLYFKIFSFFKNIFKYFLEDFIKLYLKKYNFYLNYNKFLYIFFLKMPIKNKTLRIIVIRDG